MAGFLQRLNCSTESIPVHRYVYIMQSADFRGLFGIKQVLYSDFRVAGSK